MCAGAAVPGCTQGLCSKVHFALVQNNVSGWCPVTVLAAAEQPRCCSGSCPMPYRHQSWPGSQGHPSPTSPSPGAETPLLHIQVLPVPEMQRSCLQPMSGLVCPSLAGTVTIHPLCGTEGWLCPQSHPQCHSAPCSPHSHRVPGAVEAAESHSGHRLGPVPVGRGRGEDVTFPARCVPVRDRG